MFRLEVHFDVNQTHFNHLTIKALKDKLAKRNLSKKGNKQTLVSRLKSSLQSTRQKTSAVSDQTDTSLLCTARDETNNVENCPCLPLLLDLQNEKKAIKANSSRQTLPNLNSDFELSKLQDENNALKQTSRRERQLRFFKA